MEAQDTSLKIQLDQLERDCDEVLVDRGSGRTADREGYQKLLHWIESGKVASVTAIRLDRLGRDEAEARHLLKLCQLHKVEIDLRHDGVWSAVKGDELAEEEVWEANSQAAAAESKRISMRLRRHYRHCDEKELTTIRKSPLGFQIRQQKVQPNHSPIAKDSNGEIIGEWQAARYLIDQLLLEESLRAGRNNWNEWLRNLEPLGDGKRLTQLIRFAAASVGTWLEDPTIRGGRKSRCYERVYDPKTRKEEWRKKEVVEVVWDQHESILTVDEHKRITAFRKRNRESNGSLARSGRTSKTASRNEWIPIHPLMRCGVCGSNFTKITNNSKNTPQVHYYCTRRQRNKAECSAPGAPHKNLHLQLSCVMADVGEQVLNAMSPVSSNTSQIAKLQQSVNALQIAFEASGDNSTQTLLAKQRARITELQAEDRRSATQHGHTLKQWEEAQSGPYWFKLLSDPVAGHRKLTEIVEWFSMRNGQIEELKLHRDEQVYWVADWKADAQHKALEDEMQELVDAGVNPEEAVLRVIG